VSLFRDSSTLSSTRGWSRYPIASTTRPPAATTCPPTSTFTTAADIAANRHNYELLLATPLPFPPVPGSPVRLIRRARYSLYRASDGLWYLGYRRCTGAGCATVQPVSGPYAGATPPLTFKYYDGSGRTITPLVPTTAIARIDVVAHAATPTQVKLPGLPLAVFTDSSVTSIALRNAP
jgi:hypothetical protein